MDLLCKNEHSHCSSGFALVSGLLYSAPSRETRFLGKLLELLYPLYGLELRSQK